MAGHEVAVAIWIDRPVVGSFDRFSAEPFQGLLLLGGLFVPEGLFFVVGDLPGPVVLRWPLSRSVPGDLQFMRAAGILSCGSLLGLELFATDAALGRCGDPRLTLPMRRLGDLGPHPPLTGCKTRPVGLRA